MSCKRDRRPLPPPRYRPATIPSRGSTNNREDRRYPAARHDGRQSRQSTGQSHQAPQLETTFAERHCMARSTTGPPCISSGSCRRSLRPAATRGCPTAKTSAPWPGRFARICPDRAIRPKPRRQREGRLRQSAIAAPTAPAMQVVPTEAGMRPPRRPSNVR